MKYLKILAISILLHNCSANKNVTTDLEKIGLNGKVKNLRLEQLTNKKENEDSFSFDNEFYFNQNGMISKQKQYSTGDLIHIYTYEYDEKNLLISKKHYNSSREFVSKSIYENEFNEKGKLTKQSEYKALENSIIDSVNIKFNLFPDQITELLYNKDGGLSQYNIYDRILPNLKNVTVFNNGEIIKNSTINTYNGELFSETIYKCVKYDTTKNCIQYKLRESDSTESYIKSKIEYYK